MVGIVGIGRETYLFVHGLLVNEEVHLTDNHILMPVQNRLPLKVISKKIENDIDFAIIALCSKSITAQLKIIAGDSKDLAISAWNSQWDLILLSAIFQCESLCNLQSTHPIEQVGDDTILHVTNYAMHGVFSNPYTITKEDIVWLQRFFTNANSLLDNDFFRTAVHSMWSYRWHSMPRVQLAILWAGIESLFPIDQELTFRFSLYISKFLAGSDNEKAKEIFSETKKLYGSRSSAVHGGNIKGDLNKLVTQSASLLNQLILKCIVIKNLPNIDDLIYL